METYVSLSIMSANEVNRIELYVLRVVMLLKTHCATQRRRNARKRARTFTSKSLAARTPGIILLNLTHT